MPAASGSSVLTKDALVTWSLSMARSRSTLAVVATRLALKSSRAWAPVESLRVSFSFSVTLSSAPVTGSIQ